MIIVNLIPTILIIDRSYFSTKGIFNFSYCIHIMTYPWKFQSDKIYNFNRNNLPSLICAVMSYYKKQAKINQK